MDKDKKKAGALPDAKKLVEFALAILAVAALAMLVMRIMSVERYSVVVVKDASMAGYYEELAKECSGKASTACCMASVKAMAAGGFELAPRGGACSVGERENMMKCVDSFRWCEPAAEPKKGETLEVRGRVTAKDVSQVPVDGPGFVTVVDGSGASFKIVYSCGMTPDFNRDAYNVGSSLKVGDEIEAGGVVMSDGAVSVCGSKGTYLRKAAGTEPAASAGSVRSVEGIFVDKDDTQLAYDGAAFATIMMDNGADAKVLYDCGEPEAINESAIASLGSLNIGDRVVARGKVVRTDRLVLSLCEDDSHYIRRK